MTSPDADDYWRISKRVVSGLLWGTLLLVLIIGIFSPTAIYDYTDRARISELLAYVGPVKDAIAAQLEANPQAEIDASIADLISENKISYKTVARDGTIIVVSNQVGVVLVFHPQVEDGKVQWSCRGNSIHGEKSIPAFCRAPIPAGDHAQQ